MADFKKLTVDGNTYNVKDAQARLDAASAQNTAGAALTAANLKMPLNGLFVGPVDSKATDSMALGSTGPNSTTTLTAGTGANQSGISLTDAGVAAIKGSTNVTIDAGGNVITSSADIDIQTNSGEIYTDDNDIFIQANDYVKLKSGGGYALSNDEIIATRPWVMNQIPAHTDPSPLPLNVPYNFRRTPDVNAKKKKVTLVGGTLVWNQLVDNTDTSCTVDNGHKYISFISGTFGIGSSDGSAIVVDGATGDKVFDLTKMFGSTIADYVYSLGSTDAVNWFRNLFPNTGYTYNAGELMSVNTDSAATVGFNLWNEEVESGTIDNSGNDVVNASRLRTKGYTEVMPSTAYYYKSSTNNLVLFYDDSKTFLSSAYRINTTFTTPLKCRYIRFAFNSAYGTTYLNDVCLNFSDAALNGRYEQYQSASYSFDQIEIRGLFKLGTGNRLYCDGDTYEADGTVTRYYGLRAYEAGDESLPNAITDGTNTVYELNTPTTETATGYTEEQTLYPLCSELLTDAEYEGANRDVAIPVGNITLYERDVITVPVAPATPGQYWLVATVGTDGTAYYTWEV